jgi:hypothetical protein
MQFSSVSHGENPAFLQINQSGTAQITAMKGKPIMDNTIKCHG